MANKSVNVKPGYNPVAGEWYPEIEYPRPAVYHKYAKQDVIGELYPDLVEPIVKTPGEITAAINSSIDKVIEVKFGADMEMPPRTDGKITTIFVPADKTLVVDLNGHTYTCQAYAFYVYGKLIINDSKGTGKIVTKMHTNYSAISNIGGYVELNAGEINTFGENDDGKANWMYGVSCSNGGLFNMNGGTIHTDEASCLSTNNMAGIGNYEIKSGKLLSDRQAAIYQASMDYVTVGGDTFIKGGIAARMGHITVKDNAKVYNNTDVEYQDDLGVWSVFSGNGCCGSAIILLCGTYTNEELGNDCEVVVKDNATLTSMTKSAIEVCPFDSKYDQKVTVTVEKANALNTALVGADAVKVYSHEELIEMATAAGKTLNVVTNSDITVTIAGEVVYPTNVEETPGE